jgi:hypothetical protein
MIKIYDRHNPVAIEGTERNYNIYLNGSNVSLELRQAHYLNNTVYLLFNASQTIMQKQIKISMTLTIPSAEKVANFVKFAILPENKSFEGCDDFIFIQSSFSYEANIN